MIGQRIARQRRSAWLYLLGAMGLVIVLLGAINLAVLLVQALDKPQTPFPGQLLYVTTFDAYNQQWSPNQGQMYTEINNGELHVVSEAVDDGPYSVLDRVFGDFDLRVDSRWVKVSSDDTQLVVIFRYQDRNNYYALKIRGDGAYSVELRKDGNVDVLSQWHISPAIKTALDQVNQLRVVAKSYIFSFYINDQQLPLCLKGRDKRSTWTDLHTDKCLSDGGQTRQEIVDLTFNQGAIGLGAKSGFSDAGVEAAFDNVLIMGPQ
jgi:hypothetical protein